MFCRSITLVAGLALLGPATSARAGNPLIPTVYAADPSAHVWPGDDRLWVYASNDTPGTNSHDTMVSYHVFSTRDLINWTDYGVVLHLKDVPWAISHMWAIDCVYRNGEYTLVYCAKEKGSGIFRTGLAKSSRPEGPFTDVGFVHGVEGGQDPAVFIDEDNKPYLFWGAGGVCHGAELKDDLSAVVPGTIVDLTRQLENVYEGPWVHRYSGQYYLSYPGLPGGQWPENMYYATSEKPLGPYHFRGKYIPEYKRQAGTNHGSIIEYKGRWYALHHSAWVTGMSEVRNLMADELKYKSDGSIETIQPSVSGAHLIDEKAAPSRVTVVLEAENGSAASGELRETRVERRVTDFSGTGYVTGFGGIGNGVQVMVQNARPRTARLKIRYRAVTGAQREKVIINKSFLLPDPKSGYTTWEKYIEFPEAKDWTDIDLGIVHLREGDNWIDLYSGGGAEFQVDRFTLEPTESLQ